jgi:hypothetical protein
MRLLVLGGGGWEETGRKQLFLFLFWFFCLLEGFVFFLFLARLGAGECPGARRGRVYFVGFVYPVPPVKFKGTIQYTVSTHGCAGVKLFGRLLMQKRTVAREPVVLVLVLYVGRKSRHKWSVQKRPTREP